MKYLFTAIYSDGTIFPQTHEDISSINPLKSAYYDINHEKLVQFKLTCTEKKYEYLVDLRDGHFEINGINLNFLIFNDGNQEFRFHGVNISEINVSNKLRLIYFRKNVATMGNPNIEITFNIGWQTIIDNQNIKKILEIT